MKIGLFADAHYCTRESIGETRRPALSLKKLREAMRYFKSCRADLVICLGDLIDSDENEAQDAENLARIAETMRGEGSPCCCCMGNHDGFLFEAAEFERISGLRTAPMTLSAEGKKLILLNANHTRAGAPYRPGDVDWTDTDIPPAQISWLADALRCDEREVYVFVHQNLDPRIPEDHRIACAERVRSLFEESGRVRAVYQGHYHPGAFHTIGGIDYITLKAMCEGYDNPYTVIEI